MADSDLLPSWRAGAAKTAIGEFVRSVTTPGPSFVPPAERIATFDNDGTLWCELRHDDAGREFAYDAGAEQALAAAAERDWLVVSMKDDFAEVF
jgi:hypothetical protein